MSVRLQCIFLCLAACVGSAAVAPTCNSEDGECTAEASVSLLQTSLNVVKNEQVSVQEPWPQVKAGSPFFDETTMPAVSTTNRCISALAFQYFGLYTALAIVRTLASFKFQVVGLSKILETGCTTITYAPMLCVLFLGARLRAIQLSQGETEKYELPQPWVQDAMLYSSYAVIAQVALVLLVGFVSGMTEVRTDAEGNLDLSKMTDSSPLAVWILTLARYVVMALLYGGFSVVVYGIFTMEGPKEIWGDNPLPVSPAVKCTILLSTMFFLIYLLVAVTKTCFEVAPSMRSLPGLEKLEASAGNAKMTVSFAPMLCVLFIGARMRALQIDPEHGNPQSWAQKCFFMCTFSVLVQSILALLLPFVTGAEAKRGDCEGDFSFAMENRMLGAFMELFRYICLFALYGGVSAVVYSIFTIEHPDGPSKTPPVSPALKCSIFLTAQYFLCYTGLFVCITIKSFVLDKGFQVPGAAPLVSKAITIFDAGRGTVMFAPMLSCMFIGARMRALQLAKDTTGQIPETAGPQKWVQDAMFLSTWAVMIQLIMAMLVTLLTGVAQPECDEDGNVKLPAGGNKYFAILFEVVRYACMVMMYGGATTVVAGVFMMTPLTIQPYKVQGLFPSA